MEKERTVLSGSYMLNVLCRRLSLMVGPESGEIMSGTDLMEGSFVQRLANQVRYADRV